MIWVIAEGLGIEYAGWVKLYQSKHFKDEYPEDNQRFHNVIYIDDVGHNREYSLRLMRERMFSDLTSRRPCSSEEWVVSSRSLIFFNSCSQTQRRSL
jgi:hypothetical protein